MPPRASQCIRPDLSSVLDAVPAPDELVYEAPTDAEANGDENEAETAAVFSSFVVFVVTVRYEFVSTVLCKRAPSKIVRVNMVPVHTNYKRFKGSRRHRAHQIFCKTYQLHRSLCPRYPRIFCKLPTPRGHRHRERPLHAGTIKTRCWNVAYIQIIVNVRCTMHGLYPSFVPGLPL